MRARVPGEAQRRDADRPQLKKLIAAVGPGDVVIIPAVDRLSRDTTDLLAIARDLQKTDAGLRSIAEPVVDTTSDFAEMVLAMLGVAAKLERRRIKERMARGRADAKAKGVKFGRKPKLTAHQRREAIKRRDVDEETLRSIGRSYNVSAATISRLRMTSLAFLNDLVSANQPAAKSPAGRSLKGSALRSVLSIDELSKRPSRSPDHAAESRALIALAQQMAVSPAEICKLLLKRP